MQHTDKQIIKRCFSRNTETYKRQAVVQQQVASKLADLTVVFNRVHFKRVLEIGCGTGFLTSEILSRYSADEYYLNDIADTVLTEIELLASGMHFNKYRFISGDAETISLPKNNDAIFSSSCFQWFNHFESFVPKAWHLLSPKGILAFSTFGRENYNEIKAVSGVGLEYLSMVKLIELLRPSFNIVHAEQWVQKEYFPGPLEVLKHMKLSGVNGLKKGYFGKAELLDFQEKYRALFSNSDEMVSLTYHPILILAQKKNHDNDERNRIFYQRD